MGIEAVIFDMDGLMIDSEPVWHVAEIAVFKTVGVELTEKDCLETTGLRVDEMVRHWKVKRGFNEGVSESQVAEAVIQEMVSRLEKDPQPMPGLQEAIQFFEDKNVPLAVASSSPEPLIHAALQGLGIKDKFKVIRSAVGEQYGKPHPAVYLRTAEDLGVHPTNCVALEDSLNGAISAKAARMKCIAVPDLRMVHDTSRFNFNDVVIHSLRDLSDNVWEKINM